jgi:chromosome segregation ATPase
MASSPHANLSVRNIGGIDEAEVQFSPGITILEGKNATNRTSLLQAIMAACGSDNISIKGDADEAQVELTIGEGTYTRTLTRSGNTIKGEGDPYVTDPTLPDLFAFLLEWNEARREVRRGEDLRDLIMRPIDTDEIQQEIEQLMQDRRRIDEKLEEIESLKGELPELEEKRVELQDTIETKSTELEGIEEKIESMDANPEERREKNTEFEEKLEELSDKRSMLEEVRYKLETERDRLNALETEQEELQEEESELDEIPIDDLGGLESEINRLRGEKQELQEEINEIQSIIGFNEEMLEAGEHEIVEATSDEPTSEEAVTDQLLEKTKVSCWTCGREVEREQIEATVERLRTFSSEKFEEISEIESQLDELTTKQEELKETQRRREKVKRGIEDLETKLETQKETIQELEDRRDNLRSEIQTIEENVEELEDNKSQDEILDFHKQANQLEYEIGRLETDLENVTEELKDIETEIDRQDDLEQERNEIQGTIEDLRTKIERIERQSIEKFNEHMASILDILEYQNLERIWLERAETEVREGRRTVSKTVFEIHVVRSTNSGTTYEDSLDHLSESEREVTGLIFALAGYLVHDVHEIVPFMLLDSLEAIDSGRIATLIEYFSEYCEYLVVALLPEDAAAMEKDYHRVTKI